MLCRNPRCMYQCKTKSGYCYKCAYRLEQKKEMYFSEYTHEELSKRPGKVKD